MEKIRQKIANRWSMWLGAALVLAVVSSTSRCGSGIGIGYKGKLTSSQM